MCADPECESTLDLYARMFDKGTLTCVDQKANLELRLPALRDTCILMTSEVDLEWEVKVSSKWGGKLRGE